MTPNALYRLGRYSARRPWRMIATWLVLSVLVVVAAGAFGQKLENTFGAPGLDSQKATDLLTAAGADQAGLTAQLVATPIDGQATFADAAGAKAALLKVQAAAAELPHVLRAADPAISPDGKVAIIRLQYPVAEQLAVADLQQLKEFVTESAEGSPLRLEAGGDLFSSFAEAETGLGELIGLSAAVVILLVAFGSLIAMGLPIGLALFGIALGISSLSLVNYLIEIPSWAPVIGSMVGLGVGIDYALFLVTRHREYLAQGLTVEESAGRAVATAGKAVVIMRRDGGHRHPRACGRRSSVPDRRWSRGVAHRADHGRCLDHLAPRVPRPGRALDQPARHPPAPPARNGRRGLAAMGCARFEVRQDVCHRRSCCSARAGCSCARAAGGDAGRGSAA